MRCSVTFGSIPSQRPVSISLALPSRSITHRRTEIWIIIIIIIIIILVVIIVVLVVVVVFYGVYLSIFRSAAELCCVLYCNNYVTCDVTYMI